MEAKRDALTSCSQQTDLKIVLFSDEHHRDPQSLAHLQDCDCGN